MSIAKESMEDIFKSEKDILNHANEICNNSAYLDNELLDEYKALTASYKRLLNQVIKLVKIGDNQEKKLKKSSSVDGLTGLLNKRVIDEIFNMEILKEKSDYPLVGVIMIDIDFFKKINDTHGHIVGDLILKQLAEIFKASLRDEDLICRYGGEEFLIVIKVQNPEGVAAVCEKLRKNVEAYNFSNGIKITISAGCTAKLISEVKNYLDIINIADKALYQAKNKGRNMTQFLCE